MKKSSQEQISNLIARVQELKTELENLQEQKSKSKLELYYDIDNEELKAEIAKINERNKEINLEIIEINKQLLELLNNKE